MNYYYTDSSHIGVLISEGYGAGWSTWNQSSLAWDSRVIEFWKENSHVTKDTVRMYLESIGYNDVYLGGWKNLVLVEVPVNCCWRVKEYDGFESVEIFHSEDWNYVGEEGTNE